MIAQRTKEQLQGVVLAAVIVTLVGVLMAPLALAKITRNTIDPVATVTQNGRQVIVTGPISCTERQRAELRVSVTQRSTGAVAEGTAHITCARDTLQWEVRASTRGNATFEAGPATAVALAASSDGGDTDDAHQWLVEITLRAE